jgi:hypothetical protein
MNKRLRWLGLLWAVLVTLMASGTTTANAATFNYDGGAVARVDVQAIGAVGARSAHFRDTQERSASPSIQAQGTCTTPASASVATEAIPSVIYREGTPRPGNLTPRAVDDGMLSFRDSLSNPWTPPAERPPGWRPVLRPDEPYIGIATSQLPPGSVIPDNVPPGHVSVTGVSVEDLQAAVTERGKFPK